MERGDEFLKFRKKESIHIIIQNITTITIDEKIHLEKTNFSTLSDFMTAVVNQKFPDSWITDSLQEVQNMQEQWLPDDFVNNFMKSYE